jgi:hypothetical protein
MTTDLSHPSGSALRERMIEDMSVRGFSEATRRDYIRCVKAFAAFIGRSPDTATAEDLRASNSIRLRPACSRRASTARSRRCASSSP